MDRKSLLAAQALMAFMAIAAGAAEKEDEVEGEGLDRTPIDCISINRIKRTKVIDDQTVLFEMNGDVFLSNMLERTCPGLAREGRFMHETQGRLCDIDTITVLEQWGTSFRSGFTCQLGDFHPITEIEADELILGPDVVAEQSPDVEIKEVELPPDEAPPEPETEALEP